MITRAQYRDLAKYLKTLRNELYLQGWRLHLDHEEPPDKEAYAWCEVTDGRRVAHVRVCADFLALELEIQRDCLVHELLHVATAHTSYVVYGSDLDKALGVAAWTIFAERFRLEFELLVDDMTAQIAPRMPLPPWPKGKPPPKTPPKTPPA